MLFKGLVDLHSVIRWVALIVIVAAVVKSFSAWRGNKPFTSGVNRLSLITLISFHTQFLLGIILYAMSPAVSQALSNMPEAMGIPWQRFFSVEHSLMMIIAVALVTVGRVKAKKAESDLQKNKLTFIFFLIALLIVLAAIPWPFRDGGIAREWFPGSSL